MMENSCANNLEIDQEIQEKKYGIEFDSEDDFAAAMAAA